MKVLVTGASGLVGSHLCRALAGRGHGVVALVRRTSRLGRLEGVPCETARGDVLDEAGLRRAHRGVEVCWHAAAHVSDWGSPALFRAANVRGTAAVLRAARAEGVRRVVHVSSVAVYGFRGFVEGGEDQPFGTDGFRYCISKREAEERVRGARGIEVVLARPGNVYGPGDALTTGPLLDALSRGRMALVSGGRTLTCPAYVENLAEGLALCGEVPAAAGRAYNLTDGLRVTWREWLEGLARALSVPPPRLSLPAPVLALAAVAAEVAWGGRSRPPLLTRYRIAQLSRDYHFSIARARRDLGWEPRVGPEEAARRSAQWFRTQRDPVDSSP